MARSGIGGVVICVDCKTPMDPHDSSTCQLCRTFGTRRRSPQVERARKRIVAALDSQRELLQGLRETQADRDNEDPREIEKPKRWWKRWRAHKSLEKSIIRLERRYFEAVQAERIQLLFPPPAEPERPLFRRREQVEGVASPASGQVDLPWD